MLETPKGTGDMPPIVETSGIARRYFPRSFPVNWEALMGTSAEDEPVINCAHCYDEGCLRCMVVDVCLQCGVELRRGEEITCKPCIAEAGDTG